MNTATAINTLPVFEYPEAMNLYPLPMHVVSVESRCCVYCGSAPIWSTYEEYVEHFYASEWEGDRWHTPDEREEWEAYSAACGAIAA